MSKRINGLLNIIISTAAGVFAGHGIYEYWHHKKYPGLYAMQSAPWYTGVLVYGAFTLAVVAVCFVLKLILRKKGQR